MFLFVLFFNVSIVLLAYYGLYSLLKKFGLNISPKALLGRIFD